MIAEPLPSDCFTFFPMATHPLNGARSKINIQGKKYVTLCYPDVGFEDSEQYCPKRRVDNLLRRGDDLPDPLREYLPDKVSFGAGFWKAVPGAQWLVREARRAEYEGVQNIRNSDLHTYGILDEVARMEWEDQASLCQTMPTRNTVRFYKAFLRDFGWIHAKHFNTPEELQHLVEEGVNRSIVTISEKVVYNWNVLARNLREQFSGYFVRGRDPTNDWELYSSMCRLRVGTAQERREAVCILDSFQKDKAIRASEVRLHEYTCDFEDAFKDFTKGRDLSAATIENWLDRTSPEWYNKDFEDAVRREYGYWPFAYGVHYWERLSLIHISEPTRH
eukprot:12415520-Karenia_brevis.AAC.1